MALDNLFTPINPGIIEISNRCVLAPIAVNMFSPDDTWSKKTIKYFEERAIGDCVNTGRIREAVESGERIDRLL